MPLSLQGTLKVYYQNTQRYCYEIDFECTLKTFDGGMEYGINPGVTVKVKIVFTFVLSNIQLPLTAAYLNLHTFIYAIVIEV